MTETVDIETYLLIKTNFVIRKEDYRLFLQFNLEICMLQWYKYIVCIPVLRCGWIDCYTIMSG